MHSSLLYPVTGSENATESCEDSPLAWIGEANRARQATNHIESAMVERGKIKRLCKHSMKASDMLGPTMLDILQQRPTSRSLHDAS